MKKIKCLITTIFLFTIFANAQVVESPSPIKWYTIEQAQQMYKKEKRPIIMDVYTGWCGWCKVMMKNTFANQEIANYIQNNFYPVRFDAETSDTIKYNDSTYTRGKYGKTHDLAVRLLVGQMSYPTIVYFDREGKPSPVPGYMEPKKIMPLLAFFAEDVYKNTPFDEFEKFFNLTFVPADSKLNRDSLTKAKIKWLTFEEASRLQKEKPKKMFVNIYVDPIISSRIMDSIVYRNPGLAKYINTNYYPVRLNAISQDTINFMGSKFINQGKGPFSIHQLAGAFLQKEIKFPSLFWLDEKAQLINKMSGFYGTDFLNVVFHYFGDDAFKSKPWEDYYKTFKSN